MTDKLSDLIKLRNNLSNLINELPIESIMAKQLADMTFLENSSDVSISNQLIGVINRHKEYSDQFQHIIDAYKNIIVNIDSAIYNAGTKLINDASLLSPEELYSLATTESVNLGLPDKIISQLFRYSNTIYPGLLITPCLLDHVKLLVASDPLYIAGSNIEYIKSMIADFPDQYRNRLGIYSDLEKLPMNQFSLVVVPGFFFKMPYPQVIDYLKIILRLLRPGGITLFTFHNCDIYELAVQAENGNILYSSQSRLEKDCTALGYGSLEFFNEFVSTTNNQYLSWAMLTKSGELATAKRTQSVGVVGRK